MYAQVRTRRRGPLLPEQVFVVVPPKHRFVPLHKKQDQEAEPAEKEVCFSSIELI